MLNFLHKVNNCFRKASKMFIVYKTLVDKYENEAESESLVLSSTISHLWYPTNYNNFKPESNLDNFLTQIIILTFLLKYYNNTQAMADFDLALKEFYEKDLDFSPISQLCEKYGKNISLKYILTAYNVYFMSARQTDCYDNENLYKHFNEKIIINKDFINNATNDIIDINFNEFTEKYNVKILERNKTPDEIYKMLHDSLAHVQKFDFINYKNSVKQYAYPYNIDLNDISFAKNIFSKKFGFQTLYCVMSIGNVLSHYYYNNGLRFGNGHITGNLVEMRSERFADKIGNIFDKLYAESGDFTAINAYLKLVQDNVRFALRNLNKFEHNEYSDNEQLDFSKPYRSDICSGRLQIDGTATITRIRKLCQLLDYNIIDEFVKMPVNMWETMLEAKRDKFDDIMDEFNLAIINCANLAFSTIDNPQYYWKGYIISFNNNITPTDIRIEFDGCQNIDNISYNILLNIKFYDYFNVVDDVKTKIMAENRLKLIEQVEKCLENMKKLANVKQVKRNINITTRIY